MVVPPWWVVAHEIILSFHPVTGIRRIWLAEDTTNVWSNGARSDILSSG